MYVLWPVCYTIIVLLLFPMTFVSSGEDSILTALMFVYKNEVDLMGSKKRAKYRVYTWYKKYKKINNYNHTETYLRQNTLIVTQSLNKRKVTMLIVAFL